MLKDLFKVSLTDNSYCLKRGFFMRLGISIKHMKL